MYSEREREREFTFAKNCTSNLHSYGQTRNLQRNNKHEIINTHYHENQF